MDGAAWNGTILSDNAFFHPLAAQFSPIYAEVLETTYARVPSEMKAITLMRAREDIKSAGLWLQQIYDKALAAAMATGWYEVVNMRRGRRVRPLKDEALADKRADVGLPDRDEANARLLRAGDPPRQIARAIESYDPLVLVADAHVTGEVAYEPIGSGPRSLAVEHSRRHASGPRHLRGARQARSAQSPARGARGEGCGRCPAASTHGPH